MLIDFLKNIMYVFVICVFLYLILGQKTVEGMATSEATTSEATTSEATTSEATTSEATTSEATMNEIEDPPNTVESLSTPLTKVSSSDVSQLFERVNTQTDIIRTLKGSFDSIIPLKIDGVGDERIVLLKNIKLLLNNGVFKNETDLKGYEYIGNKAVNTLVSEVNNLNMEIPDSILEIDKKEIDYMNRSRGIIEEHQKIIDLELKRRSK
jgi:hypothetical protein